MLYLQRNQMYTYVVARNRILRHQLVSPVQVHQRRLSHALSLPGIQGFHFQAFNTIQTNTIWPKILQALQSTATQARHSMTTQYMSHWNYQWRHRLLLRMKITSLSLANEDDLYKRQGHRITSADYDCRLLWLITICISSARLPGDMVFRNDSFWLYKRRKYKMKKCIIIRLAVRI